MVLKSKNSLISKSCRQSLDTIRQEVVWEQEMLHRHDISDKLWEKTEKKLPGSEGYTGRPAEDNRRFINAVFWILRTGAPWRDLPPEFGDWKNRIVHVFIQHKL